MIRSTGLVFLCAGWFAGASPGQVRDWVARFDDVAPASESPLAAVQSPTGETYVLAKHSYGFVLLKAPADDSPALSFPLPMTPENSLSAGPAVDATGAAYVVISSPAHSNEGHTLYRLRPGASDWQVAASGDVPLSASRIRSLSVDAEGNCGMVGTVERPDSEDYSLAIRYVGQNGQTDWMSVRTDVVLTAVYDHSRPHVTIDSSGNLIVATAASRLDGSPGADLFVAKYSGTGAVIWEQRLQPDESLTPGSNQVGAMVCGEGDSVYLCGVVTATPRLIYTMKLGAGGELLWSDTTASSSYYVVGAALNPTDGGICIAGKALWRVPNQFNWDFVAARYSPDGERVFVRYLDGGAQWEDMATGIHVAQNGTIYIGGSVGSGYHREDIGVFKLSPLGDTIWFSKHNSSSTHQADQVNAFTVDRMGRPVCLNAISNLVTSSDVQLVRFDADVGTVTRTTINSMTHSRERFVYGAATGTDGSVYICGNSERGARLSQFVAVAYDSDGTERWRRRSDTVAGDAKFIAVDSTGNIVVAGTSADNVDSTEIAVDIFVVKYTPDGEAVWQTRQGIGNSGYILDAQMNAQDELFISGHYVSNGFLGFIMKVLPDGTVAWLRDEGLWAGHEIAATTDSGVVFTNGFDMRRYSHNGDLVWSSQFNEQLDCEYDAADISIDSQGHIVLVGAACADQVQRATAIAKYDDSGELLWHVDHAIAAGGSWAQKVLLAPNDDIFIAGLQRDVPNGGNRCFVARYSGEGQVLWITPVAGILGTGSVRSIGFDPAGFLYMLKSSDSADVPGYSLLRFDLDGTLVWRAFYGPAQYDAVPTSFAIDHTRRPVISGYIRDASRQSDFVTIRYTAAPPPCPRGGLCDDADTNGDCRVDTADLENVLTRFGATHPGEISPLDGDLNFDGRVDLADLTRVLGIYGSACD